ELLARELVFLLGLDPLGREHREHVVERPDMAHGPDRAVGGVDELRLHRHPDMGMGRGRSAGQQQRTRERHQQDAEDVLAHAATITWSAADWRRARRISRRRDATSRGRKYLMSRFGKL